MDCISHRMSKWLKVHMDSTIVSESIKDIIAHIVLL
jgi:hypothetical protein